MALLLKAPYLGERLTPVLGTPQEAELMCRMFEELGTNMLTKLQGSYSFCLYDQKLVRCPGLRHCCCWITS